MFGNLGTSANQRGQTLADIKRAELEEDANQHVSEDAYDALTDALGHGDIGNPRIKARVMIERLHEMGYGIVQTVHPLPAK